MRTIRRNWLPLINWRERVSAFQQSFKHQGQHDNGTTFLLLLILFLLLVYLYKKKNIPTALQ